MTSLLEHRHHERGGATLEYVLVSTFAAAVSIAAMAYVGRLVKSELATLGERLGHGSIDDMGGGIDDSDGPGWEP